MNILLAPSYNVGLPLSRCALDVRIQVHCNCILGPLSPALFSSLPLSPSIPRLVFHTPPLYFYLSSGCKSSKILSILHQILCCQGVGSHEMVKYSSPLAIWILQRTWIKMLKCIHVKYSGSMFKCIGNKFYFLWNVEKAQIFSFPTCKYPNCQPKSGRFFKYYCRALLCYQTGMTPTSSDSRHKIYIFNISIDKTPSAGRCC